MKTLWGTVILSMFVLASCSCLKISEGLTITSFLPSEGSYVGGTFSASVIVRAGAGVTNVTLSAGGEYLGPMTRDEQYTNRYWRLVSSRSYPDGPLRIRVSAKSGTGEKGDGEWNLFVDNTPPDVSLLYPSAGRILSGSITLYAEAADNLAMDKVVFSVNGIPVGEVYDPSYRLTIFSSDHLNGPQILSARAYDRAGNASPVSQKEVILRR